MKTELLGWDTGLIFEESSWYTHSYSPSTLSDSVIDTDEIGLMYILLKTAPSFLKMKSP